MSNRYFRQFVYTLEPQAVKLWARVTFGAAGAPTIDSVNSKGVKSISRTSQGIFVVTFGTLGQPSTVFDSYNRILKATANFFGTTAAAAPLMQVRAQAVATAGTVTLQFFAVDGTTSTDPDNGGEVWLEFSLKNSTAP